MIRLVKFSNGYYGIRKGWVFHEYVDFMHPQYAWSKTSRFFECCMTTEEKARELYNIMTTKDEVIDDEVIK